MCVSISFGGDAVRFIVLLELDLNCRYGGES